MHWEKTTVGDRREMLRLRLVEHWSYSKIGRKFADLTGKPLDRKTVKYHIIKESRKGIESGIRLMVERGIEGEQLHPKSRRDFKLKKFPPPKSYYDYLSKELKKKGRNITAEALISKYYIKE